MTSTFTSGANTITPAAVYDYETSQEARTIAHQILGSSTTDFTFRPASGREGTLRCVFATEASANTARTLFATVLAAWTWNNTDRPTVNMTFAVVGKIGLVFERSGAFRFDVGYKEG